MTEQANIASNMQKYANYKEQFKRLHKALDNGFNLEAIFIEYAIAEDRTESILHHSGYWDAYVKSLKGRKVGIDSKIRYIQKKAECKHDLLHRYFSDELLGDILLWKEERNRLIHALLKQELVSSQIEALAMQGNELVKQLRNKSRNYNRAIDKANEVKG